MSGSKVMDLRTEFSLYLVALFFIYLFLHFKGLFESAFQVSLILSLTAFLMNIATEIGQKKATKLSTSALLISVLTLLAIVPIVSEAFGSIGLINALNNPFDQKELLVIDMLDLLYRTLSIFLLLAFSSFILRLYVFRGNLGV